MPLVSILDRIVTNYFSKAGRQIRVSVSKKPVQGGTRPQFVCEQIGQRVVATINQKNVQLPPGTAEVGVKFVSHVPNNVSS